MTKIGLERGLSSPNVRKIVQDKYGFIWLATQDGLNRFDGINIIQFNSNLTNTKRSLTGSDVYDLLVDENKDNIWVLTAYGGLDKVDLASCSVSERFRIPADSNKIELPWLQCMAKGGENILIGNKEGNVFKFNIKKSEFLRVNLSEEFGVNGSVDKIYVDEFRRVWIFLNNKGILITDLEVKRKLHFIDKLQFVKTKSRSLVFTDLIRWQDKLLVTTKDGLKSISVNTLQPVSPKEWWPNVPDFIYNGDLHCLDANNPYYIVIAGDQALYRFSTLSKNIDRIVFSRRPDDNKWLTLSHSIYQTDQSIWIGSQYGLAWIKNISTPFTGYFTSMAGRYDRIEHSITICSINDTIAVICGDDGLYYVQLNSSDIQRFGPRDFYYSAFKITHKYILASGDKLGLQLFDMNRNPIPLKTKFPELETLENDLITSGALYRDSIWYFASQNQHGIYKWNIKRKEVIKIDTGNSRNGLKSNVINRLYFDRKGELWILCDNVISIYNPLTDSTRHIPLLNPENGLQLSIIMDMCEHKSKYWLGVYGAGIVELDSTLKLSRMYSYRNGISNTGIYKIFPFNDSIIIASSNNGLHLFNVNQKRATSYFEYDGLHSSSFEEMSGSQQGNYILIGGINGFTKVEPAKYAANLTKPALFFSDIRMQSGKRITDTFNIHLSNLDVPSNVNQVTINFSALNFIYPEKVQYMYMIKGINESWTSLGSKNSIELMGISPGRYHLTVKAINEDGVESDPIELYMHFTPKWYQTLWFQLAIIALILATAYGIYRYRVIQLHKEANIRKRIASDLHDDLGSTLNGIKVFVNLALAEINNKAYLLKIKQGAQEAISGLRDVIWVLDDKEDSIEQLSEKIARFATPLCEANNIAFIREIESSLYGIRLKKEAKRSIYLTLKEAINNSIKYATCSQISLIIRAEGKQVDFIIKDNGKGFNTTQPSHGNGLKNIHFRAKQAGYKASIQSAPGQGTTITLTK